MRRNPLQLTLAGLVGVLLLGGVSVVWWQLDQAGTRREADLRRQLLDEQRASADAARLARNAEAVASLLGHAQTALQDGDAAKAAVVLETARKRCAEGGAEKDAERLLRLEADLALVRDLDELDNLRWTSSETGRPEGLATQTQEVLRRFGTDPDMVSLDEATERVSSSVVRERIVEALDRLLRS